jgi:transposase-like protein
MKERKSKRYSMAFKRKVVREVETGELSVQGARRLYDIGGGSTVYNWLDAFGKTKSKTVHIQTHHEDDPMTKLEEDNKKLREEKEALESALAQTHLRELVLESTVEVATEHFGVDIKKDFGTDPSSAASQNGASKNGTGSS